jgi:hypothetical protein
MEQRRAFPDTQGVVRTHVFHHGLALIFDRRTIYFAKWTSTIVPVPMAADSVHPRDAIDRASPNAQ